MNIPIETNTNPDADTRPTQKSQSSRPLYIFFLLLAATLLNGLDSSEFTGAANVIARDLHLTISDIGMLASAFTLLITISAIPLGLLADRASVPMLSEPAWLSGAWRPRSPGWLPTSLCSS
jgi:MFS family permease